MRVRDEIKMTIQAYQTLYESSIAYGMRKALQSEQSKAEMLIKISSIEEECGGLEEIVDDLKKKINRMLNDEKKDKINSNGDHEDEVNEMSDANQS